MDTTSKKLGYLKGILESAKLDPESDQGKILNAMFDVVNDLCDRAQFMSLQMEDLSAYVESIDDDLTDLENDYMDDDDVDDDYDFDDDIIDFNGDGDDDGDSGDDSDFKPLRVLRGREEEKSEPLTIAGCLCPECGKVFFVDEDDPDDAEYICPHCAKKVLPEILTPENAPMAKPVEE